MLNSSNWLCQILASLPDMPFCGWLHTIASRAGQKSEKKLRLSSLKSAHLWVRWLLPTTLTGNKISGVSSRARVFHINLHLSAFQGQYWILNLWLYECKASGLSCGSFSSSSLGIFLPYLKLIVTVWLVLSDTCFTLWEAKCGGMVGCVFGYWICFTLGNAITCKLQSEEKGRGA